MSIEKNNIICLYNVSNDEMKILLNHINETIFERDAMIDHIKSHTTIDGEIFTKFVKEEYKSSFGLTYLSLYKEKNTAKFIKRVPVYFYDTNVEDGPTMTDFFNGYYVFKTKKLPIINFATDVYDYKQPGFNFESLYDTLDQVVYEYDIDLKEMLSYLVAQTGSVKNYEIFDYWMKYLKLIEYKKTGDKNSRDLSKLFPRNILYSYNIELEKRGLTPKVFLAARQIDFDDAEERVVVEHDTDDNTISLYGFFPIDEDGNPVEKWIGVWAEGYEDAEIISVNKKLMEEDVPSEVYEKLKTALKVSITYKIGPKTRIFAAIQEVQSDPENVTSFVGNTKTKEYWEEVFTGAALIELDIDILVKKRMELDISIKTAADETGINLRTYQRIENQEASPDALNIIKIMSYLGINSYEDIIKKQIIEDSKFKKFISGAKLSDVLAPREEKEEN